MTNLKFSLKVLREKKKKKNLSQNNKILFGIPTYIGEGGVEESGEPAGGAAEDNTKTDHIKGKHTKPEGSIACIYIERYLFRKNIILILYNFL